MLNISIKEEENMGKRNFMGFNNRFEHRLCSIGLEGYPDIGDFVMLTAKTVINISNLSSTHLSPKSVTNIDRFEDLK